MFVETPEIRWHFGPNGKNEAILSVHVLPQSNNTQQIMASGGADKEIKLWKLLPTAADSNQPRIEFIHSFAAHDRSVNAVRFSPNGEYLASASDDASIIIWTRPKSANPDTWRWDSIASDSDVQRILFICGHKGDITDLAWSPDSKYICSTSVDNRVVIWNVPSGKIERTLADHNQFVQGAAWDPGNRFLATQGNDRVCRIYTLPATLTGVTATPATNGSAKKVRKRKQDSKYQCIQILKDQQDEEMQRYRMFRDDTFSSFFRRLSWTPDGSYLLVPSGIHRKNSAVPSINTVYAFERTQLDVPALHLPIVKPGMQLSAAVAVKCSPVYYELRKNTSGTNDSEVDNAFDLPYRFHIAVITLDSVLVYDTQQPYPIAIAHGLHYADLTDVCWTPDGKSIIISSLDGYCTFFSFLPTELGLELKKEDITVQTSCITNKRAAQMQGQSVEAKTTDEKENVSTESNPKRPREATPAKATVNTLVVRKKPKKTAVARPNATDFSAV